MLPLIGAFQVGHQFAEFEHRLFIRAFQDLRSKAISASNVRREVIRSAADTYYRCVSEGRSYFLDKTPRYTLICEKIKQIYPDSISLVLLRHPFESASSMLKTFGNGHWCLFRFRIDFFVGLRRLADFVIRYENDPRVIVLQYRDICNDPDSCYQAICAMTGLDPCDSSDLDVRPLAGALGDPLGRKRFGSRVAAASPNYAWASEFNTYVRRRWARKVMSHISVGRFEAMGYDYDETLRALKSAKYSFIREISDVPYLVIGVFHHLFIAFPFLVSLRRRFSGRQVFGVR